jgi:hypothetical protein
MGTSHTWKEYFQDFPTKLDCLISKLSRKMLRCILLLILRDDPESFFAMYYGKIEIFRYERFSSPFLRFSPLIFQWLYCPVRPYNFWQDWSIWAISLALTSVECALQPNFNNYCWETSYMKKSSKRPKTANYGQNLLYYPAGAHNLWMLHLTFFWYDHVRPQSAQFSNGLVRHHDPKQTWNKLVEVICPLI